MPQTIAIKSQRYAPQTNEDIQRAVNLAFARGGGVVTVSPGTYIMHNALHLRSRVRVVGLGEGDDRPRLLKAPSVQSRLIHFLGYGHFEFGVAEPEKFRVGMGVHLTDNNSNGFYDTVATIVARDGELFYIDRMFNHDYLAVNGGVATSLHPIVEGCHVHDTGIENIIIDGNVEETRKLNGCRGGGVFLINSHRIDMDAIDVQHFNGDAVSFQQCTDIVVRNGHIHHNRGHGLHPGSGSVRYVFEHNRVEHNEGDGLFYCLRTTHGRCAGNTFTHNAQSGISIGERDTDHLIADNRIEANGRHGISFRTPQAQSGDRVRIEQNIIGPNSAAGEQVAEIDIPANLHDILLVDNDVTPAAGAVAMHVGAGCTGISAPANRVAGRPMSQQDVAGGGADTVRFTAPGQFPAVGPEALPLNGARHLNIQQLRTWRTPCDEDV